MATTPDKPPCSSLIGHELPVFDVKNVATGVTTPLSEYIKPDKITVIDIWGSFCGSCPGYIDRLEALAKKDKINKVVNFLTINMDDVEKGKKIIDRKKWTHITHLAMDPELKDSILFGKLGLCHVPHAILVDVDGKIVKNAEDFHGEENAIKDLIKKNKKKK